MTVYGTEQLADLFGITEQQARKLMKHEGFPSFKIGRAYKITEQDLQDWIHSRPVVRFSRKDRD